MKRGDAVRQRLLKALVLSNIISVLLYLLGALYYHDNLLWFLNWNLALAWLPLLFSYLLIRTIKNNRWLSTRAMAYSLLWIGFLPNSFYIASDLIHIRLATSSSAIFYATVILSYTINGFILGFTSLYLIHKQLIKRLNTRTSHIIVTFVLFISSFAIYLGRYMRWNTWDLVVNPSGLIFDVSDRIINPVYHKQTFLVTILLFLLLSGIYMVIWQLIEAIRSSKD